MDEISRLEQAHDVTVLYACESGSRAWGFESEDSDYDVRFIYLQRTEWYLTIQNKRDVIEKPIDDELDVSGWDVPKALELLRKSNPPLLEWLQSPIVYKQTSSFIERLRKLMDEKNLETLIEVDGGVGDSNAGKLFDAGANVLVAGNSVFSAEDPVKMISQLKNS